MTTHGHDEYGRALMCGTHSVPERRLAMRILQSSFPDFFYEDEERSVWATAVGQVIYNAVRIASDPKGPSSRASPSPLAIQALHKSHGAAWVTSTITRAIKFSATKATLIALTESSDPEQAAHHLASEAINAICRDWTSPPSRERNRQDDDKS